MKNIHLLMILLLFANLSVAQERNLALVKEPTENPTRQQRKAVVIGMSDYGSDKSLDNTLNDATDIADMLTLLGFEVTLLKNNDWRNLKTNLNNWYNTIKGNDVAVFYFAGHGMEVNGENYLIPVDAELNSQTDVQYNALNVNQVLDNMDERQVGMKLLILDACRDNPFKRSWTRGSEEKGLAGMAAPEGTFIAFAASPGATAQDGGNYSLRNGVFTHYLKQEIVKEGASIDHIFTNVSKEVSALTHREQTPFRNSSLTDIFYFIPPGNDKPDPSPMTGTTDVAELLRQAKTYYDNKQYSEAFPLYKQAAEQGHSTAQNYLGLCYEYGRGVSKDYTQAVDWYKKAAEQGYSIAQSSLGNCYYNGYGVSKDYTQAVGWYKKAAEQGNSSAQYSLGYCYKNGEGISKDYAQAVYWYKKSAEQGHSMAQNNLGVCYKGGEGVAKDKTQAVYWYKKAAEQGNSIAQDNLGYCYYNGEGISKDNVQAVYWYKKAAEQGHSSAQNSLGNRYYNGEGVDKDNTQAAYWYKKAADQGNSSAQYSLGNCYYKGEGISQDNTQAIEWYKKAANQGNSSAQYSLGNCYAKGEGVSKDEIQAVDWYKKAANQGHVDAKIQLKNLGISYP
jgi:TPR repeat protein